MHTILKYLFFISCISGVLASCNSASDTKPKNQPALAEEEPDLISQDEIEGYYTTIEGTLVINADGDFVFRGFEDDSKGIACPTFLIPNSDEIKAYVEDTYNAYASIRNSDEQFYITLDGAYLNLHEYLNGETSEEGWRLEFLFDSVSLGASQE